ncbi:MAG: antibiotic biosynthesis monooxygenase [Flavobacteriaceae bacterium]
MAFKPPYYAVIFTNLRTDQDPDYTITAHEMEELAKLQPGYLGFESARDILGITISYWESLDDIANWKSNIEHLAAQQRGIEDWYKWYKVRICRVEREYEFFKKAEGS